MLQLKKFPDIAVSTGEEATRVRPTSRVAPFPPHSSRGGILSLRVRERIPGVPVASQEEALSTGKARGTAGSCHHSQSPPDVSVHSRETCFPCTASTFKPRIHSHHGGTWDSPVGKSRGKASRESHRSLDPREGKRDTAATARESRPHRQEPRFRLLDREEGSFPCVVGKEFPAFPSHLKWRRSPQDRREELQGRATFPESPRCLSPFQGNLFPYTASTVKTRIQSHHGGTRDSPVGKPRVKVL